MPYTANYKDALFLRIPVRYAYNDAIVADVVVVVVVLAVIVIYRRLRWSFYMIVPPPPLSRDRALQTFLPFLTTLFANLRLLSRIAIISFSLVTSVSPVSRVPSSSRTLAYLSILRVDLGVDLGVPSRARRERVESASNASNAFSLPLNARAHFHAPRNPNDDDLSPFVPF